MLDQRDDPVRPRPGVLDRQIVAVDLEELPHRHKASALVSLREGMRLRDASHQPTQRARRCLPRRSRRNCAGAPMRFQAGRGRAGSAVLRCSATARLISMTASIDSHRGSFGKGGPDFWKPPMNSRVSASWSTSPSTGRARRSSIGCVASAASSSSLRYEPSYSASQSSAMRRFPRSAVAFPDRAARRARRASARSSSIPGLSFSAAAPFPEHDLCQPDDVLGV